MELIKTYKYQKNYHKFDIRCDANTEAMNFFISSDWHFDNPKCKRDLLFRHLDEALEKKAFILVTGDLLCLMQGKYDPRRDKGSIREEHNDTHYLDLVINDTAEKLRPYAKNILMLTKGNHETSVSQRVETDVLGRLVERINALEGTNIQLGAYTGYYTLQFEAKHGGSKKALHIGYSHGKWGGVVTKGTLSVMRRAASMPDCDIMFSGHTHDGWIVPQPRMKRNSAKRKVQTENQWHVRTGTYKEEFEEGEGWATEKISMPKYIGGCFMKVFYSKQEDLKFRLTLTN